MCCATSRLTSFSQDIDSVHGTPIPRATHQFGPFVWNAPWAVRGQIRPLVWRMGTAWTLDNRLFMMLFVNRVLILALHFISSLSIPHTKSHIASPDTVLESWAPKHELYPERYALKQIRNCFFIEGWTFKKILKYFLWKV